MKSIQSIIKANATQEGVTYHKDYSGRGMYGRQCIGISGSRSECMAVIKACIVELHNEAQDDVNDDTDYDFEMAIELVFNYNTDSMGYDTIVYWPGMQDDQE